MEKKRVRKSVAINGLGVVCLTKYLTYVYKLCRMIQFKFIKQRTQNGGENSLWYAIFTWSFLFRGMKDAPNFVNILFCFSIKKAREKWVRRKNLSNIASASLSIYFATMAPDCDSIFGLPTCKKNVITQWCQSISKQKPNWIERVKKKTQRQQQHFVQV